ncbi:hypothetical protein GCM10025777_31160 [Membranihabitans marinus]|uniref:Uncharacterized protein n=2 Tax=Nesterenkonia rhizosphaerae TaxID=1348272 RepID=A0ABP9FTF8_9MICC
MDSFTDLGPVFPTEPPQQTYAEFLMESDPLHGEALRDVWATVRAATRRAAKYRREVDWMNPRTRITAPDPATGVFGYYCVAQTRPLPGRYEVRKTPAGRWGIYDHRGKEMSTVATWRYALRCARYLATEYAEQLRDTKHAELFGDGT